MNKQVANARLAYNEATKYFNERETHYRSNQRMWKDTKEYGKIREARWTKDEARKEQTRKKKECDAVLAKSKEHHLNVNYNTSEGISLR